MKDRTYISVILPLRLEWEPCYSLPDDAGELKVGDRVKVKFANHPYTGVVSEVGVRPDIDAEKIQEIISVERGLESVLPEEIAFWKEVAEYYMCSVGEVYKAAYPAMKVSLEEARAAASQKVQERRRRLLDAMRLKVGRIEERLRKKEELLKDHQAKTKEKAKGKDRTCRAQEKLQADISKITEELNTAREALKAAESNSGATDCRQAGVWEDAAWNRLADPELSPAQKKAYKEILAGFDEGKPVLLHGVTGSGKTEIYIRTAKEILRKGRNVLYLVPEIALSRQLEERLRRHLGEGLMVFHSGESAASRRNTAERIRETGNGYIVLGTRSSLFLPHHDLGLIIIDEEHDTSYKQDSPAPRYNGRDAALMLASVHSATQGEYKRCRTLMGSATPSLEELYNCQVGKHLKVNLEERYHGANEAEIEIIDTRAERRKNGMKGNFSRRLIARINEAIERGEQVMILRSRRSWAPVLQCEDCGEIVKCPHCSVSLSLHADQPGGRLICHYCGFSAAYTAKCSKCGGSLKSLGAGTQKIEEEAQSLFPDARIARLDSDTTRNKTYETQTIKEFSKGEIDILIGTQMVTKGFDFSGVSVVAVIAADSLLGMQDFRADEKAAQLLEQFRGRCGRRERKGLFVIQTSQPEHPVYQNLISGAKGTYTSSLMQERRDFMFPPFARIIEVTFRDTYEDRADRMAGRLAQRLSVNGFRDMAGPYAPAVDKMADQHIRCIRISLRKDRNLKTAKSRLKNIVREFEKENRYDGHIVLNADPS